MENSKERFSLEYKQYILTVFEEFLKICEEHNLRYFCHGGTAIGVIRHKGFIPWDDDIDVLMPRPDYEKFIDVFKKMNPKGYELHIPGEQLFYYLPFMKMVNKNTTLVEFAHIPYVIGAYIDIFPLDAADKNADKRGRDWLSFRRTANKLMVLPKPKIQNFTWFFKRIFKGHFRTAVYELECLFLKNKKYKYFTRKLNELITRIDYEEAEFVGSYGSQFGTKAFWPKDWFNDYVIKEFEGLKVRVPLGYDKLLTQVYGDYMKLPPVESRISQHNVAYCNLNERVSFSEINKDELRYHDY